MQFNSQYVDTIYLSRQAFQPHNDYVGLFKVIDYFRNTGIKISVWRPHYFVSVDVRDYERAKTDTRFRHSILHQYPLETTNKKYLCMMHNDMLFHKDIIGDMLKAFEEGASNLIGTGSIGQCWSCPAGPD
ncbi:hypothetical protein [Runella sp.]|uniref:hypothetical protein n=1 Tax=Runella sp. TaxID=1960881 RepID=UPI003D11346C